MDANDDDDDEPQSIITVVMTTTIYLIIIIIIIIIIQFVRCHNMSVKSLQGRCTEYATRIKLHNA